MVAQQSKHDRYLDELITVPAAAEMCGISRQTMRENLNDGLIPFVRPRKQRRVRRRDVIDYLASVRGAPVAAEAKASEDLLAD